MNSNASMIKKYSLTYTLIVRDFNIKILLDSNKDDAIDLQEATDALKDHIEYEQNYYMFFDGKAGK